MAVLTEFVPARGDRPAARTAAGAGDRAADDLRLTLTLTTLQPGDNTFAVPVRGEGAASVRDVERVTLRITDTAMDMGEAEAIAAGPYLTMSGRGPLRAIGGVPPPPTSRTVSSSRAAS